MAGTARARRSVTLAIGAVVIAAALGAAVWLDDRDVEPGRAAIAGPVDDTTSTTVVAATEEPPDIVGRDEPGRLVIADPETGDVNQVLVEWEPGGGASGPSAPDDGRFIYFGRGLGTCAADVARLDRRTGAVEHVAGPVDGGVAAGSSVSADGTVLAFTTVVCGATVDDDQSSLVVRDLVTGSDRSFALGTSSVVGTTAVSSDGQYVAFATEDGAMHELERWDQSLGDATTIERGVCELQAPAYLEHDVLAAVTCDGEGAVVAAFDHGGTRFKTVATIPDLRPRDVLWLDATVDGSQLLYGTVDASYRWDGHRTTRIPGAITGAAWIESDVNDAPEPSIEVKGFGVQGELITIVITDIDAADGTEMNADILHTGGRGSQGFAVGVVSHRELAVQTTIPRVIEHEYVVAPGRYRLTFTSLGSSPGQSPSTVVHAALDVVRAQIGQAYRHVLTSRCDVVHTFFDGGMWVADPQPDGWSVRGSEVGRSETGTITLVDADHATFTVRGDGIALRPPTDAERADWDTETDFCS